MFIKLNVLCIKFYLAKNYSIEEYSVLNISKFIHYIYYIKICIFKFLLREVLKNLHI